MTSRQRPIPTYVLLALLLVLSQPLEPAVITVGGTCNLNAAIDAANDDAPRGSCPAGSGSDVIKLTAGVPLTIVDNDTDGSNGLPSVTSRITVEGNGYLVYRDNFGVPTPPPFRVFHVGATGDLRLKDLTVLFGRSQKGGGIYNRGGLTLKNSTIGPNLADVVPGSRRGGGIYAHAASTTRVVSSVISNNSVIDAAVRDGGGGIWAGTGASVVVSHSTFSNNDVTSFTGAYGGAVGGPDATVTITNSTISGNSISATFYGYGGGVAARDLSISNSTVSGNTASVSSGDSYGGGVWGGGSVHQTTFHGNSADYGASLYGSGGGLTLSGSLFAAAATGDHCEGTLSDAGGGNLADDATCLPAFGSLTGLDLNLADNGGPTQTHELLDGSSAIDNAGACGLGTDQRGAGRMGSCDSGAFEHLGNGCSLKEFEDVTISTSWFGLACHTGLVGPNFIVDGPLGSWDLYVGYLAVLRDGFEVREGAELSVTIDPSLLPPPPP
ncbi:MAG: hypothetical protein GY769_03525 [bacterium]|nr:hypothetical protein [bacterium]